LDGDTYDRLVAGRIRAIVPHVRSGAERDTLSEVSALVRERLCGRELPLVRSHGDFTNENCLYDSAGQLVGVIDWELSAKPALPLLDLVQAMDIAGESSRAPRWQRGDIVLDGVEGRGVLASSPEIAAYVDRMQIPSQLVPFLLLMHWVDHVGARVEARRLDRGWMTRRVHQPLARLRDILAARRAGDR